MRNASLSIAGDAGAGDAGAGDAGILSGYYRAICGPSAKLDFGHSSRVAGEVNQAIEGIRVDISNVLWLPRHSETLATPQFGAHGGKSVGESRQFLGIPACGPCQ